MSVQPVQYVDRRSGELCTEPVFAARLLFWTYDNRLGRLLGQFLLRQPLLSRIYGWLNKRAFSRRRIGPFARAMGVNIAECLRPLGGYQSFNDFFIREIDLTRRPVDADPLACVAPADGRIVVIPHVDPQRCFRVKGGLFVLRDFLANAELTRRFAGGAMAIIRLHLADYHHFHFPVPGVPMAPWLIGHRLHAVGPYARRWPVPFFSENRRSLTLIRTGLCGLVGMAEVGACTVGSIRQTFRPAAPVEKGERKGFFEVGGSTVVMLFQPGAVRFDEDLCANSAVGAETYVRMGERIGECQRGLYDESYAGSI
jgi:phosphatidylserine decarboxylase